MIKAGGKGSCEQHVPVLAWLTVCVCEQGQLVGVGLQRDRVATLTPG